MPGKSASRCWAIRSSSGTNVRPSPTGTKRGSISFGTFTRANVSLVGLRVAHQHGERQRQVGDVGERAAEPDGERREHGEDLAPEALVELGAVRRRRARRSARCGCRARPAPGAARAPAARLALGLRRAPRRGSPSIVSAGRAAVLARASMPGVDLVLQAGDADHEELVEVAASRSRRTSAARAAGPRRPRRAASTRSLNCSHDSSRLKYSAGSARSTGAAAALGCWSRSRLRC